MNLYIFGDDAVLVDAFDDEQDAARFVRDHPGTTYTDWDNATDEQQREIAEWDALSDPRNLEGR